ncbi:MAG TPA: response regulator, partial [Candidatus Aciduliprofundum boonei]|nr:response regulator [Candidatus Aciduliprofundum boonei]
MSDENITLLVVDDNKELVKIIKTYLKRRGFNILAAYTAHEALRIIEESKKKIRLMLLDLMLPDMPGQEVLKLIREMNSDIGIIVITGVKDIQTAVELMKAGADDYIT